MAMNNGLLGVFSRRFRVYGERVNLHERFAREPFIEKRSLPAIHRVKREHPLRLRRGWFDSHGWGRG